MTTSNNPRKPILILAAFFIALSLTLALLTALSSTHTVQASPIAGGTNVSGPIITHTIWTVAGSPYVMTDNVMVNPGITLTIEPGVLVQVGEGYSFSVDGHLKAMGTPNNTITFTAVQPDSLNVLAFPGGSSYLNNVVIDGWVINVWDLDLEAQIIIENSLIGDS